MKRSLFFASLLLTLCSSAPAVRAVWVYGPNGPVWVGPGRPAWGGTGYRPAAPNGYGVPVAPGYPPASYYSSYYGYPSAAYPQVQPAYPVQPPPAYGRAVPNPWVSSYAYPRSGQQLSYPVGPARVAPRTPAAEANDQSELAQQRKRANFLSAELDRVRHERDQAQSELARWTGLGVSLDQIRAFQAELAKLQASNKFLVHRNDELEYTVSRYVGPEREVKMPANLTGRIVAINPKFSFVVLNIGEKQGAAKDGKLLVNRDGKLMGKVRITTVDANSSIANILQDWKMADLREGDQVLHQ